MLADVATEFGDVTVVAPDRNRSAISQAITLLQPLRVHRLKEKTFAVEGGTPADCVYVGLHKVLKDSPPDFVLSGINPGPNLGWDVHYSGTVAAARESVLQEVPAIAFSLLSGQDYPYDDIRVWVSRILAQFTVSKFRPYVCINVNIPNPLKGPIRGIRATHVGQRVYSKEVTVRKDPRGSEYLWVGGERVHMPDISGSDCNAVRQGYVSVTALGCDPTCRETVSDLKVWEADEESFGDE